MKTLVIASLALLNCFSNISYPLTELSTSKPSPMIKTRAEVHEWRYKIINNRLYKRLYNRTTGEWIGDWILVS